MSETPTQEPITPPSAEVNDISQEIKNIFARLDEADKKRAKFKCTHEERLKMTDLAKELAKQYGFSNVVIICSKESEDFEDIEGFKAVSGSQLAASGLIHKFAE